MSCFNLAWIENLLIWLVVIGAIVAIVRLLIPLVIGPLGAFGTVVQQILYIVLWVVIAVAVIVLIFDLLSCSLGVPRPRL